MKITEREKYLFYVIFALFGLLVGVSFAVSHFINELKACMGA